ncbi:MAG: DUF4153 domain-containing protein [Tsuneonella sp.]
MTDSLVIDRDRAAEDWPLRPWLLAALLGLAGLLIYFVGGGDGPGTKVGWQAAVSALLFFGPLAFAFSLERGRWRGPLAFAALAGLVMAGLAWRAVAGGATYASPEYGFFAGVIATAIALPLFQSGFHRTRFATPYPLIHGYAWSDAISAAGALAFTGASWLLLLILSELFHLLKIDLLRDLLGEGWFGWSWSGAAFGAALGVLRNEAKIIGTLQRVVMVVLSILAVPLAAGLALFLVAMIVSGPDVLWQATRSATPILLLCAAAAWVLANAIVRDSDEDASGSRTLRAAALVLALAVLPLTVFAAVSLGTRIAQHGLSPERLWGLVAIAVATAYGLAWLVAVVRGWQASTWGERLRRANVDLAVLIAGIALFLALPILDFGAISASNQLDRLERGEVSAKTFDYDALRWDFGAAGRRALARLARSANPVIADNARLAAAQSERAWGGLREGAFADADEINVRLQPDDPALRTRVVDYLRVNRWQCGDFCVALDLGQAADGAREVALVTGGGYERVRLPAAGGGVQAPQVTPAAAPLTPRSTVEIRTLPRRSIVVDGKPVGPPLDDALEGPPPPR